MVGVEPVPIVLQVSGLNKPHSHWPIELIVDVELYVPFFAFLVVALVWALRGKVAGLSTCITFSSHVFFAPSLANLCKGDCSRMPCSSSVPAVWVLVSVQNI